MTVSQVAGGSCLAHVKLLSFYHRVRNLHGLVVASAREVALERAAAAQARGDSVSARSFFAKVRLPPFRCTLMAPGEG